jgi:hypothetical protein
VLQGFVHRASGLLGRFSKFEPHSSPPGQLLKEAMCTTAVEHAGSQLVFLILKCTHYTLCALNLVRKYSHHWIKARVYHQPALNRKSITEQEGMAGHTMRDMGEELKVKLRLYLL